MPSDPSLFLVHIDEAYEDDFFINKKKAILGREEFFKDNKYDKTLKDKKCFGIVKLNLTSP
jgi:hypothetical protein